MHAKAGGADSKSLCVTEANSNFSYEPLAPARLEIRLLDLRKTGKELQGTLRRVSLLDQPKYEALSYCWGSPTASRTKLHLDGQPFHITSNLAGALRGLKIGAAARTVWIDAMCINQASVAERNQQVSIMREIYASCERVVIYPGEPAISARGGPRSAITKKVMHAAINSKSSLMQKDFTMGLAVGDGLVNSPWFHRIWIVQEITMCPKAVVIYYDAEIDWSVVSRTSESSSWAVPDALSRLLYRRREHASSRQEDILDVVAFHHASLCTDVRDQIYGLLGLVEPDRRFGIEPDYASTAQDLFFDFTARCLDCRVDLDVLSAISPDLESTQPSWVFSYTHDMRLDVAWHQSFAWRARSKGLSSSRGLPHTASISQDRRTLSLVGMLYCRVSEIGLSYSGWQDIHKKRRKAGWKHDSDLALHTTVPVRLVKSLLCYSNWRQLARAGEPQAYSVTGQSRLEAFWQTCCGYTDQKRYVATEVWLKVLDAISRPKWCNRWKAVGFTKWDILLLCLQLPMVLAIAISKSISSWNIETEGNSELQVSFNRRFFLAENGAMGLGPRQMMAGDSIVLFKGARVPLVIRKAPESCSWRLVGEAYIHGIMQGEAFDEMACTQYDLV